jgi:folate-binding protein YgfZ
MDLSSPMPSRVSGSVRLGHLGVIRARGADATTFLQSQLTNDVAALAPDVARLAGFCSAKGRLQASFLAWKDADDDISLACAADLLAPTLKRLSMFVLRARCRLTDDTAEQPLHGLVGDAARAAVGPLEPWARETHEGGSILRLPDAAGEVRAVVVGKVPATVDAPAIGMDRWRWLEVESGVPTIEAATVDRFVPQMVNFELLGGVDFRKGCYPGQEVVARSQYRGTLKRRMARFDADAAMTAADEVYASHDREQPAGMVVNAAPHPAGGWSALVELKLAALDDALHLRSADGPALVRRALPYGWD